MGPTVEICFNPIHEAFTSDVPLYVHRLKPTDNLLKVAILVLEAFNLDSQQSHQYQLRKCNCGIGSGSISETILDTTGTIKGLGLVKGERLFLRRKIDNARQSETIQPDKSQNSEYWISSEEIILKVRFAA